MMIEYQILERLKRIEQCLANNKQLKWLDLNTAVNYLGISKSTILRALRAGKLKGAKTIGKWMFKTEWLDNFLEDR